MTERLLIAGVLITFGLLAYRLFARGHRVRATLAHANHDAVTREHVVTPAVLYFRSDHCAPCVAQAHFLEQLVAAYGPRVAIQKIDADIDQAAADRYGIFTLPTTLVIDQAGNVRHTNYGLTDTRKLTAQLQPLVGA